MSSIAIWIAAIFTVVSQGSNVKAAAMVFLLAGPATNVATMTVLIGILGKRAAAVYLTAIAVCAVGFGLLLDQIYLFLGVSTMAVAGEASGFMPRWVEISAVAVLLAFSIKPVGKAFIAVITAFQSSRGASAAACGTT